MLYVWSLFVRTSHWLLVAAFAVAWLTRASMWHADIHVMAGYAAGILMTGRICWGLFARGYCNFTKFPFSPMAGLRYVQSLLAGHAKRFIGHNPAGSLAIYGMLAVGLLTVGTGLVVLNNAYLPDFVPDLANVHGLLAKAWLALVVVHVCGVIAESLLHHENLIATMITGLKQRHLHVRQSRRSRWRLRVLVSFRKMLRCVPGMREMAGR